MVRHSRAPPHRVYGKELRFVGENRYLLSQRLGWLLMVPTACGREKVTESELSFVAVGSFWA
eukprot:317247-Amphidinium_carterae.1